LVSDLRPTAMEQSLRQMMGALSHRGPDDEGRVLGEHIAVGMRRLSIIDLAGGHQPIYNENCTLAVVLNGEIYNFRELRSRLESLGHSFRTQSDTEAVVHAYEQWGADCVNHLRGMFAFAIVELVGPNSPTRLFLARDRFGIKPLYYTQTASAFLFASEVRALLASGEVDPHVSAPALDSFLQFGSVSEPLTMVENIFSLPPGHCALISVTEGAPRLEVRSYWAGSRKVGVSANSTALLQDSRDTIAQVRNRLEEAVGLHLIADVPLGVFLSSGIDSTALAGLASRVSRGVHTFTVVFPEQEYSEAEIARRTAAQFGTRHEELLLTGNDALARMGDAVLALDQPSMDGINTYFVSRAARQAGLKVALSGLGGDEVFGGYDTFRTTPRLQQFLGLARRLPRGLRSPAGAVVESAAFFRRGADAASKLAALWRAPDAFPHAYFYARALFSPIQASELRATGGTSDSPSPSTNWLEEIACQAAQHDGFSQVSWLELRSYMTNTLLRDTDSMSMAHSLEVRVPFLDHVLVESVLNLPETAKRGNGEPKSLLRQALADLLPAEVTSQRKRTFTLPWEAWLRGPLRSRVDAGLAELAPPLEPLLDRAAVSRVWASFPAGHTSWSRPWSLYVLNEWVRGNLCTTAKASPPEVFVQPKSR